MIRVTLLLIGMKPPSYGPRVAQGLELKDGVERADEQDSAGEFVLLVDAEDAIGGACLASLATRRVMHDFNVSAGHVELASRGA